MIVNWLIDISLGIHNLHSKEIAHGNIKLYFLCFLFVDLLTHTISRRTILLTKDNRVKICM